MEGREALINTKIDEALMQVHKVNYPAKLK